MSPYQDNGALTLLGSSALGGGFSPLSAAFLLFKTSTIQTFSTNNQGEKIGNVLSMLNSTCLII